jgi:hypothetical protein
MVSYFFGNAGLMAFTTIFFRLILKFLSLFFSKIGEAKKLMGSMVFN